MPILKVSIPKPPPMVPRSIMNPVGVQSPYFPLSHLPNAFNRYANVNNNNNR